jgi:dipeptide/tripeptide permease
VIDRLASQGLYGWHVRFVAASENVQLNVTLYITGKKTKDKHEIKYKNSTEKSSNDIPLEMANVVRSCRRPLT